MEITVMWVMFGVLVALSSVLVGALVYDTKTGLGEKWITRTLYLFVPWGMFTAIALLLL